MRSRVIVLVVSICALAAALAGCGGSSSKSISTGGSSGNTSAPSNGVASKPANAIVSAAGDAMKRLQSVHVAGSIVDNGVPITLDLSLVTGKGGRGQMSENGIGFQLIEVNHLIYIKGSNAFWSHFGGSTAARLFRGKWLKAPARGQFGSIAALANIQQLFGQLLTSHGKLSKGSPTTVAGRSAIGVTDTTQGGTLYVATTGNPYPLEIAKKGSSGTTGGHVSFDRFNQPVTLTPPANAIDITKLG